MIKLLMLLTILLSGCLITPCNENDPFPLKVVWDSIYEAKIDPPKVIWYDTYCPYINNYGIILKNGCVEGYYNFDNIIHVTRRKTYHESAFAHELMHAYEWEILRIENVSHSGYLWDVVLPRTNQELERQGY